MVATPPVSVIIPAFDAARYLAEAIESVLRQQYEPLEILVVDDGSTDDTGAVASRFDTVQLIRQENAGAGAARNTGVERATGELYAFLDADDVWLDGKLRAQAGVLANDPSAEGAFCLVEEFCSDDLSPEQRAVRAPRGATAARLASTLVIRAAAFERVGPFSDETGGELIDWLLRADETGLRLVEVDEVLVRRRLHDRNMGVRVGDEQRANYVRALKRSLDRRRGA